ncbi:MAG: Dps family protein [Pseudomonadota bacterium]
MSQPIVDQLSTLLASTYTLSLKTQNFHWNVTGPMFTSLHTLFEIQYNELATAVDEIAERIRTLGVRAPASYSEFAALSVVEENSDDISATDMVRELAQDQQKIADLANTLVGIAGDAQDEATASIATDRLLVHEKAGWMLRSHLD